MKEEVFMSKKHLCNLILLFMLIVIGCSTNGPQDNIASVTEETTPTVKPMTTSLIPENTFSPTVTSEPTLTSSIEPTTQTTLTPEHLSNSSIIFRDDCPTILDGSNLSLLTSGSILFETNDSLWAITADNLNPQLIYSTEDITGHINFYIEDGSSKILAINYLRSDGNRYIVF